MNRRTKNQTPRCFPISLPLAVCATTTAFLCGCVDLPKANDTASSRSPQPANVQSLPSPAPAPIETSIIRERAIEFIERLAGSTDPQIRANAVEAASYAPARLSRVIEKGLLDTSPAVRSVAAMAVGRARLGDLAPLVAPLLSDSTSHVRISAIYALVACGQPVDRSPLAAYLLEDPSPYARRHAAFVLGEIGDPSAMPLLRAALRQQFPATSPEQTKNFQLQVAEAMIKLGDEGAKQVLRASLYPSRPEELEVTALAVQILGEIRDRDAVNQLIYLADFRDSTGQPYPAEVRLATARSLAQMDLRSGGSIADEYASHANPAIRAQAAFVYAEVGGKASWSRLSEMMMKDPSELVQIAAAAGIVRSASKL
jgi:HEAT repeat protein